jgi:RHS repeat-associated protein
VHKSHEEVQWDLVVILCDRNADGNVQTGEYGHASSGLEERCWYTTDGNGNVTTLLSSTGAILERYVYEPYGKTTIYDATWSTVLAWANTYQNEVLYAGYRFDFETGLYHVRNRMYHPTLGRWLQRDPKGYVDGMSLYEYCRSMPVSVTDSTGQFVFIPLVALAVLCFAAVEVAFTGDPVETPEFCKRVNRENDRNNFTAATAIVTAPLGGAVASATRATLAEAGNWVIGDASLFPK